MRRCRHAGMLLVVGAAVAGCGGSSASQEADVVVDPVTLASALANDPAAALEAYGGKLLELAGTVGEKVRPEGLNPTIGVAFAEIDDDLAFDSQLSFVAFDPDDRAAAAEFEELSVGERVTLLCRLEVLNETGTLYVVKACRVRT